MTAQELAVLLLQHPQAEVAIEAFSGTGAPEQWPVTGVSVVGRWAVIS